MLRTELGEILYEKQDITDNLMNTIMIDFMSKGTVRGKQRTYTNDFITMDIETSTIGRSTDHAVAFTYSIAVYITGKCLLFRTWRDYKWFIDKLSEVLNLTKYHRVVCYVHNLPYEFQFMRNFMHIDEVFATQPRKVVKCYISLQIWV